jgi:hypothetical protein
VVLVQCGRVGNWSTVIFFQQNLFFWPQTIELSLEKMCFSSVNLTHFGSFLEGKIVKFSISQNRKEEP